MYVIDKNTRDVVVQVNNIIKNWEKNDIIIVEWNDSDYSCRYYLIERIELGEIQEGGFFRKTKLLKEPAVIVRTFDGNKLDKSSNLIRFSPGGEDRFGAYSYPEVWPIVTRGRTTCKLVSPSDAVKMMQKVADRYLKDIEEKKRIEEYKQNAVVQTPEQLRQEKADARKVIGDLLDQIRGC